MCTTQGAMISQSEAYLACAIVRPGDEFIPRLVEGAVRQGQDMGPQYLLIFVRCT